MSFRLEVTGWYRCRWGYTKSVTYIDVGNDMKLFYPLQLTYLWRHFQGGREFPGCWLSDGANQLPILLFHCFPGAVGEGTLDRLSCFLGQAEGAVWCRTPSRLHRACPTTGSRMAEGSMRAKGLPVSRSGASLPPVMYTLSHYSMQRRVLLRRINLHVGLIRLAARRHVQKNSQAPGTCLASTARGEVWQL